MKIPGFMPDTRLRIIEYLAKQVPPKGTVVDIGSYCGQTAWTWAKNIPQDARVVCIDPWNPAEFTNLPVDDTGGYLPRSECTIENFQYWTEDCPNIETIQGRSPLDKWTGPIDAIFIDDAASDVLQHINFWWPHLRKLGFVSGHLDPNRAALQSALQWSIDRDKTIEIRRRIWRIKK